MEIKEKDWLGLPSWTLGLITFLFSFFILFLLAYPFGETVGYISYDVIIIVACFFICRRDPSSVWYIPIICNLVGVMAAFGEGNFYWGSTLWIIICSGWIISVIAAILGKFVGQHSIMQVK